MEGLNFWLVRLSQPDPDTNTEVGNGHEQHDDIGNEEDVLETLQPPVGGLYLCVAHRAVPHPRSWVDLHLFLFGGQEISHSSHT